MTIHETEAVAKDDLFDLPSDAAPTGSAPREPAAAPPTAPAAQPARKAGKTASSAEKKTAGAPSSPERPIGAVRSAPLRPPQPRTQSFGSFRLARDMWIAFAALGASNLLILWIALSGAESPAAPERGAPQVAAVVTESQAQPAHGAAQQGPVGRAPTAQGPVEPAPAQQAPEAEADSAPRPPAPKHSSSPVALLRDAQEDLGAGRLTSARARLGRVLLQVDALEPIERDRLRAEANLLVARCMQAEVERARRSSP